MLPLGRCPGGNMIMGPEMRSTGYFFFFQAEDGIRDLTVTGVQTCALPILELARVLKAALCATRRVTDEGWMPRQLQVGLTGKTIEPRLYFAIGISGAPNHTVGLKRAGMVVAVNNDPDASIFERADIGLVGDWATLTP